MYHKMPVSVMNTTLTASWLSFVPEADRWIASVSISFLFAYIISTLLKKLGVSEMVGEITAGIILGIPVIKYGLIDANAYQAIDSVGEIGALLLLALAGLEIELDRVKRAGGEGVSIAFLSFIIPFLLGYIYTSTLGYGWEASFIVGIVLGVTAEEITTKVYLELDILDTRIGATTLLAAVVDDVIEVVALALVLALIESENVQGIALRLGLYVILFILVLVAVSIATSMFLEKYNGDREEYVWLYIAILLFYSGIGAILELGPVIGAILGGFFLQYSIRRSARRRPELLEINRDIVESMERILMGFLVPFFFILIGLDFNIKYVAEYPVVLIIITIIALLGKIGGTILAKPVTRLSLRQLWFIGWGMNARGTLGMILTLIALKYNVIGPELYTTIVAMAMITTIAFPFIVRWEYERNPSIVE